jgi:uncharacterized membrane protein
MLGVGVALRGVLTPIYSVSIAEAGKLYVQWCTADARIDHAAGARYQALFSDHYAWKDAGVGLILGAAALAILAITLRRTAGERRPWLRTPSARWPFLALGLAVITMGEIVTAYSFMIDAYRLYLPSCADSWGIPVILSIDTTLVIAPILLSIGSVLTLMFGKLPVALGQWDSARPIRSWVVTIVFALLMMLAAAAGIVSLPTETSAWSVSVVFAVYLLAATRAALLAPRRAGLEIRESQAALSIPSSPSLR